MLLVWVLEMAGHLPDQLLLLQQQPVLVLHALSLVGLSLHTTMPFENLPSMCSHAGDATKQHAESVRREQLAAACNTYQIEANQVQRTCHAWLLLSHVARACLGWPQLGLAAQQSQLALHPHFA